MLAQGETANFKNAFDGTSSSASAWAIAIYNGIIIRRKNRKCDSFSILWTGVVATPTDLESADCIRGPSYFSKTPGKHWWYPYVELGNHNKQVLEILYFPIEIRWNLFFYIHWERYNTSSLESSFSVKNVNITWPMYQITKLRLPKESVTP